MCVGSLGETLDEQLTVGLADVLCYRRDRSEVKEAHRNVCGGGGGGDYRRGNYWCKGPEADLFEESRRPA